MTTRRLYCRSRVLRGPRAGELCSKIAVAVVVSITFGHGTPVCGYHRKAYTNEGVARIAYWNPKEQAWL